MTFLPIVERELREGARKKSPRYTRLVVAAVALLIGLFQITFVPFFSRGTVQGGVAFSIITGFAFLLCVGAGIFFTADCLSEEKREGTLGLLFLTDLRGYDVVLGKLAAQLVHLGYALLAIIPGAALPLLLGGVTGGELWRISLALANLLLFALASGVLASSVCREAGRAMALTAAILLFFCLFLPLMQGAGTAAWGPRADWIGWPSPSLAYVKAMETSYLRSPKVYWWALAGSHMLAWLMIGIASIVIPRTWQDRPKREVFNPNTIAPTTPRTVQTDAPVTITRRNPELLEADPLLWLIGQRQGVKAGVWAICVLWLVVVFIAVLLAGPDALLGLVWIGWAGLLGLKVLFTFEACRFFASTRRAGAFEFLLSTPINANRLISAQWATLRRTFGPPLIAVVIGTGVAVAMSIAIHNSRLEDLLGLSMVSMAVAGAAVLLQVLDMFALAWLGMWLALTMKKPQLAAGATLLYVIVLPWVTTCYAWFFGFILDIILIAVFATKLNSNLRQTLINRPQLLAATPK
jgi:ABC-type transport system involved in multi-copper enzyme maturation permease subunit